MEHVFKLYTIQMYVIRIEDGLQEKNFERDGVALAMSERGNLLSASSRYDAGEGWRVQALSAHLQLHTRHRRARLPLEHIRHLSIHQFTFTLLCKRRAFDNLVKISPYSPRVRLQSPDFVIEASAVFKKRFFKDKSVGKAIFRVVYFDIFCHLLQLI